MTKKFDAVALQHAGATALAERLRGLSRQEIIEFWAAAGDALRELQETVRTEWCSYSLPPFDADADYLAESLQSDGRVAPTSCPQRAG